MFEHAPISKEGREGERIVSRQFSREPFAADGQDFASETSSCQQTGARAKRSMSHQEQYHIVAKGRRELLGVFALTCRQTNAVVSDGLSAVHARDGVDPAAINRKACG